MFTRPQPVESSRIVHGEWEQGSPPVRTRIAGLSIAKALFAAAFVLATSACDEGEPTNPTSDVPLFARYVSLGNSITAGMQSAGINDSLQLRAYPVLLAAMAKAEFNPPLARNLPGAAGAPCPAPMPAPVTFATAAAGGCVLITKPPFVSNLAVPGERLADLVTFSSSGSSEAVHNLFIGPESQSQVMVRLNPTLVSVWIGNNDVLASVLSGHLGPESGSADSTLTTRSSFNASLATLVEQVDQVIDAAPGKEDAILIGVVDAVAAVPLLQPGAYFYLSRDATGTFLGKRVSANCSPVTATGQPNPLGMHLVSFEILFSARFDEINCDPAAYPTGDRRRGAYLVDLAEQAVIKARVNEYNQAISAAAAAKGWIYLDPNQLTAPYLASDAGSEGARRIRKCQALSTATSPAQLQQALVTTCPTPSASGDEQNLFGSFISFDGVHLSSEAHQVVATEIARRIDAKHGTSLVANR